MTRMLSQRQYCLSTTMSICYTSPPQELKQECSLSMATYQPLPKDHLLQDFDQLFDNFYASIAKLPTDEMNRESIITKL